MSHFRFVLPTLVAVSTIAGAAHADTIKVGGNVINETWTPAGSPYVVQGDLIVPNGAFLTIEAGTVVRFASSDGQHSGRDSTRTELTIRGVLSVNGTPAQPVLFDGATQSPGSWYGLVLDTAAVSVTLSSLQIINPTTGIQQLGAATAVTTRDISITSPFLDGVRISAGSPTYEGLTVIGTRGQASGVAIDSGGSATLINCLLRGQGRGVSLSPGTGNEKVTVNHCTIDGNKSNGVEYVGFSTSVTVAVINSIISNNGGAAVANKYGAFSFSISFSDVWSNFGGAYIGAVKVGPGVLQANPLYVLSSNLRLTANSPARFAGQDGQDLGTLPFAGDPTAELAGVLWSPTTLTAAHGPYLVAGDLTVPPGGSLTIEPGATVVFAANDLMRSGDVARVELVVHGTLVVGADQGALVTLQGATLEEGSWGGLVLAPDAIQLSLRGVAIIDPNIGIQQLGAATAVTTRDVSITNPFLDGVRISAGSPTYEGLTVIGTRGQASGVAIDSGGSATLINCLLRGQGRGVSLSPGTGNEKVTVNHCTIDGNKSNGVEYVGFSTSVTVAVINSIISNNGGAAVANKYGAFSFSISFSDVWSNFGGAYIGAVKVGPGVLQANPLYVSATDLSLQSSSICIDTGTLTGATRDIVGVTRPLDGDGINGAAADMGAYEFVRIPGVTSAHDSRVADRGAEAPDDELSDDASSGGCSAGGAPGTLAGSGLIGVAVALSRIRRRRR